MSMPLWLNRLLGGRPMALTNDLGFRDRVSGKMVGFYIDVFGRYWMAESRWGWFRVETGMNSAEEASRVTKIINDHGWEF